MTDKIKSVLTVLVVLFSFGGCIPLINATAQTEFETYENSEFGFALEHPSDWKAEEPSPNEIYLSGQQPIISMKLPSSLDDDVSTRLNRPQVSIEVDSSYQDSLEQYVSEGIDRSLSLNPASDIKTNETTIAGLPAQALTLTAGEAGKGLSVYTMTDDGTIYVIRYTSHPDKFDTYLPVAQKIMDSFRIIDSGVTEGGQGDEEQEDQGNDDETSE